MAVKITIKILKTKYRAKQNTVFGEISQNYIFIRSIFIESNSNTLGKLKIVQNKICPYFRTIVCI
jgi:hypothetical protein